MRLQDQSGWRREIGCRRRAKQTKFKPTDVSCPSGVDAEVGVEFDCKFTGPEGVEYTAHMKVTKVEGDNVEFYVQSKPS